MSQPVVGTPARLYNSQEAAEQLGVSLDWVRRRVQKRTVPHVRLGGQIRFTDAMIAQIIEAATQQPRPPRSARRSTL